MKRVDVFKRGRLAALIAFLALGLAALPALPAQAEDGDGVDVSGSVTIYDPAASWTDQYPVAGAKVCEGGPDYNCTFTDNDGNYTLTHVVGWAMGKDNVFYPSVYPVTEEQAALFPPSFYSYDGRHPRYVTLIPGQSITGIDMSMPSLVPLAVDGQDQVKQAAPLTAGSVKIVGKKKVDKVLRVKAGKWNPKPTALSYQWYRNGHRIAEATAKSYRLTPKDRRKRIQVRVVATVDGQKIAVHSKRTPRVR